MRIMRVLCVCGDVFARGCETVERSDFFFSDALHPRKPFYGLKMRMNKIKTIMITYVIEIYTP